MIQTVSWASNAMNLLERCRSRYGPTFTVRLLVPGTTVFVSSPETAKMVLAANPSTFTSGEANVIMEPVLGSRSVVMLDGDDHLGERRRLLQALHVDRLNRHRTVIEEVVDRELAGWRAGQSFPLQSRMEAVSFEVIMRTIFGADEGPRLNAFRDLFLRVMKLTADRASFALLMSLTPNWGRYSRTFRKYMREVDAFIRTEVERRRIDPRVHERADVLSQLIVASREGPGITDAVLRDQLITLLVAGYETTATGLAWSVERLVRNPEALSALEDELASDGEGPRLEATIKEALRVRTLAPVVFRKLRADTVIGDAGELPAGTILGVSPHLMHRLPEVYPDPAEFRPERFMTSRPPDTYTWTPFGGGVRRCLGASFSLFEMKIVLAAILRRASLRATDARDEPPKRLGIIYRPAHGAMVTVAALKQGSPSGAVRAPG